MEMITVANDQGMRARVADFGAIVMSLEVPDREGQATDVVLGHDSIEDYLSHSSYFGAVVGRYANRIHGAGIEIDGKTFKLAANERSNCLHGGKVGFDKVEWKVESHSHRSLTLTHRSSDGDQGFPGNLDVRVRYTVTGSNELVVDYDAMSDAPTVVNLTQHSYFNLGGHDSGTVMDHELMIAADTYTPVDEYLIPTGEIARVAETRFDLRTLRPIPSGGGYDHNFILNRAGDLPALAAMLRDPQSGRTMLVRTSEPGVQLYTGNHLDGAITGKNGARYGRHAGLCLETQHFPDSPHHPHFPSTQLRPGQRFTSRTIFEFGVT